VRRRRRRRRRCGHDFEEDAEAGRERTRLKDKEMPCW